MVRGVRLNSCNRMHNLDLENLNCRLETAAPQDILAWAFEMFSPDIAASSSFQTQSMPLLHMISQIAPAMPIFFLDTGFHFPETLAFRDRVTEELGLNLKVLKGAMGHAEFKRQHGELYRHNPDWCCYLNKVEPLQRAMQGLLAWVSGIRRDQTAARRHIPIVIQEPTGLYKVSPLAAWTRQDVERYMHEHNLPEHPLQSQRYVSIGCAPCTQPIQDGQDERAGRWAGSEKTECGLHLAINYQELKR